MSAQEKPQKLPKLPKSKSLRVVNYNIEIILQSTSETKTIYPDIKITKRPLFRPNIPSPYSGRQNQKVVYISSKTPFVSAVKRVRRLLYLAEKRDLQAQTSTSTSTSTTFGNTGTYRRGEATTKGRSGSAFAAFDALTSASANRDASGKRKPEEVLIKATGKAIAKAINLALFFQQQKDCVVAVRTGSAHAIDDIEVVKEKKKMKQMDEIDQEELDAVDNKDRNGGLEKAKKTGENDGKGSVSGGNGMNIPETRIRQTSVLEVAITTH